MGDTCARCGDRATGRYRTPHSWNEYLREEYDHVPIRTFLIPVCPDCDADAEYLDNILNEPDAPESDQEWAMERSREFIDDLDLDLLEEPEWS